MIERRVGEDLETRTHGPTLRIVRAVNDPRNPRLHDRAGSRDTLKIHGDIWNLRCSLCGLEHQDLRPSISNLPPQCNCGGLERPGVVWFGEALPQDVWLRAEEASRRAAVFLVIGTSAAVAAAAARATGQARLSKALRIVIGMKRVQVAYIWRSPPPRCWCAKKRCGTTR